MLKIKQIWNRRFRSSKVPQITLLFWLTKLVSTGLGESVSDYSVRHLSRNLILGSIFTLVWSSIFFFGFLYLTMRAHRYLASPYWLTVALLAVFGTFISDAMRVGLGISLAFATLFWFIALLISLLAMRWITGSLSIHQIKTGKAEFLYWIAVGISFVMGTSLGDYLANAKSLGELGLAWGHFPQEFYYSFLLRSFSFIDFLPIPGLMECWKSQVFGLLIS
ncbi:MAG: hypothetical protein LBI13_07945 [Streptococcaceae bacterium]|nr:hypothetical protein [Streptococcaceae bacterium]